MRSCKSLDKPAKQARMLTEGVWFEIFLSCPGDLLAIALSWFSPEKGGQEKPPVNVRGVGENHEIVKQTDSGFGVDARESLASPLSPEALLNSSLPHDLVMGRMSCGGSHGGKFEHPLALLFFGVGLKTDLFQSCGHCWVFQIYWHIECSSFIALSFRIWNSATGIELPPLALFIVAGSHHRRYHPWQRSCGEDLRGKGGSEFEGLPGPAWASTPKPESVCLTILCLSPTLLTWTGGYPRPRFSGENQH